MMTDNISQKPAHFKGKEAIEHVVEAQAQGILSSAEIHGTEIPGHISSGADSARETAVLLLMIVLMVQHEHFSSWISIQFLTVFGLAWVLWKCGRSAWLAWFRLERMHRIVDQERWEIQHHRQQEREELKDLYRAKGFEGQLLEDVMDVLMADEERLLRVMVEEELCLSLGTQEHPLKQALGALLGALSATVLCLAGYVAFNMIGVLAAAIFCIITASAVSARFSGNRWIPAIVWNLGLASLPLGTVYFLLDYIK